MHYAYHILQWPKIERNQWLSPNQLKDLQENALTRLVGHAYNNVPYYHDLFDAVGFKPPRRMKLEDLPMVPVLTKDALLAHYPHGILAKGYNEKKCSVRMTSGSSGKKLEVVLDLKVAALYRLMQFRQLIDIGYKPWDLVAYIRFSPPVTNIALQKVNFFRRAYVPLEWEPAKQVSEIMRLKPKAINAYPSVLFLLAKNIGRRDARRLGLKFLFSNSELLTQHTRTFCEDTFGCRVYDDYSCLEFSAIASECRMQKLHIAADNVIAEVLDDNGKNVEPGITGKIVLTSLNNYSMPYIRYEIGDVGALSKEHCPCGRGFPLLKNITGRCDDFIVLPAGELIDPQTIVFQIETIPEIKEFRVVQEENKDLTISIVPGEAAVFSEIRNTIETNLKKILNGSVHIDIREVQSFERGSTGKHRSILSRASNHTNACTIP
jgi:phenylacetate-CoA ligase